MSTPVNRVEAFTVVAPASTAKATPLEVVTAFEAGTVVRIEIDVPDGHAGLTGIFLAVAKGRILPRTLGSFLVANDDHLGWDLFGVPDSGAWSAFVYNTDLFDHSFYVRYSIVNIVGDTPTLADARAATPALV